MTHQRPLEVPTAVYDSQPVIVGPGQALSPAQGYTGPQIVVMQQAAPEVSWLKAHSGQLVAGAGAGTILVAVLLAVAVVAVAVTIGIVSATVGLIVIKSLMGGTKK
jgi:hypothetical protein